MTNQLTFMHLVFYFGTYVLDTYVYRMFLNNVKTKINCGPMYVKVADRNDYRILTQSAGK